MLFAAPAFLTWVIHGVGGSVLTGIYAKYFGISLAALGGAMLISRMFDAFSDPLIGWLSDRTETRLGSRKPFMIIGYIVALVAFYFLFNPGESPSITYFTVWYMALIFGWTLADIPHQAWQADISHDYDDRNRIITFRALAERAGQWAFWLFMLLPIFANSHVTPDKLRILGWVLVVLVPIFVASAVIWVPQGNTVATKKSEPIWVFIKEIWSNKPMLLFIGTMLLSGIADGFFSASIFLFFDAYLQQGDKLSGAMVINLSLALVVMPMWYLVSKKVSKHHLWIISLLGAGLSAGGIFFAEPGETGYIIGLTSMVLLLIFYSANAIAQPSMLTDIIDYDTLKHGANRSGQFFSIQFMMFKFNYAIAGAMAMFILSYFEFDATALTQSASGAFGIKFVMGGIPMLCMFFAAVILLFYPLNRHRCHVISKRLEQRAERAKKHSSTDSETKAENDNASPDKASSETV